MEISDTGMRVLGESPHIFSGRFLEILSYDSQVAASESYATPAHLSFDAAREPMPYRLQEVYSFLAYLSTGCGIKKYHIRHGPLLIHNPSGAHMQKGHVEVYHDVEIDISFFPKVKPEAVVENGMAEKVITEIQEKTNTGKVGDGKIFVTKLAGVVRVRTGEHGISAI
jgi:nitrogen regulatory protein PII